MTNTITVTLVFKVSVADRFTGDRLVTALQQYNTYAEADKGELVFYSSMYHSDIESQIPEPFMELSYAVFNKTIVHVDTVLKMFELIKIISHPDTIICHYKSNNIVCRMSMDQLDRMSVYLRAFNIVVNMTPNELPHQFPQTLSDYETNWDWLTSTFTHYTLTGEYSLFNINAPLYTTDQDEVLL